MLEVSDLFCGAGCFSEGFRQAGFKIVAGVDNWSVAIDSFHANHPNAEAIFNDIQNLSKSDFPPCDVIIGSPPCQEWSYGKNDKRNFDKTLIQAFERIVNEVKPKYWVWECAPETIKLNNSKYQAILNAYDFGTPQIRKRAFHSNFPLPTPKGDKGKNLNELFGWAETKVLFHHRSLNVNAHAPIYISNRPARTAVTWPIRIYKEGVFTVEMMKDVMGIPKSYKILGAKANQYKQIGNAVCPPLAKSIALNLLSLQLT